MTRLRRSRPVEATDPAAALAAALEDAPDQLSRAKALALVCRATGWPVGHAWVRFDGHWRSGQDWFDLDADRFAALRGLTLACDLGPGRGIVAAVLHLESTRLLGDLSSLGSDLRQREADKAGLADAVGVPVFGDGAVIAVLEFLVTSSVEPTEEILDALRAVGDLVAPPAEVVAPPVTITRPVDATHLPALPMKGFPWQQVSRG